MELDRRTKYTSKKWDTAGVWSDHVRAVQPDESSVISCENKFSSLKMLCAPGELKKNMKIILNTSEKFSLDNSSKETVNVVYEARNIHDNINNLNLIISIL